MADPLPPQNREAEESVLGSILLDNGAMGTVSLIVSGADFFRDQTRWTYEACCTLYARAEAINQITLAAELGRQKHLDDVGGVAYLSELIANTPTSLHADYYAKEVERCARMRRLIQAGSQIVQLAYENKAEPDKTLTQAESLLMGLRQSGNTRGLVPMREIVDEYLAEMAQREAPESKAKVRIPTGLSDLDRLLGGLHPTDLIILAARPAMGKTSWLANVAEQAAVKLGLKVAIFSLEMSRGQLLERLLASRAWVDSQNIRLGQMGDAESNRILQAAGELSEAAIWIDDASTLTATEIRAKARLLHAQAGLDLIMVDYVQLMDGEGKRGENRVQEVDVISKALKGLAKELRVPVLVAAQLNRAVEHRKPQKPVLSDLRESGGLEQNADVVLFLYREEGNEDEEARVLEVAKHRNGPTGQVAVKFVGKYTRFHGIDDKREPGWWMR